VFQTTELEESTSSDPLWKVSSKSCSNNITGLTALTEETGREAIFLGVELSYFRRKFVVVVDDAVM